MAPYLAEEMSPKEVVAFSNRGYVKDKKADTDGAMADYDHALRDMFCGPSVSKQALRKDMYCCIKVNEG